MEKGLFLRLKNYEDYATPGEKNFIDTLRKNPETFINLGLKEVAKLSYSSEATIYRLCRKLDYDGYKQFQSALVYEVALMQESRAVSMQDIDPGQSVADIIKRVTWKNIESLEMSTKLVKPDDIEKCVDLIGDARNINLFGVGSSLLVARDLYLKLTRIGKLCNICDDLHSQILYAKTMTKDDLAIVISYSGLTKEMIECANTARENNAKVIAITRSSGSKLGKYADINLEVAATELIVRSGAMSSRISQLNMIDILFVSYVNRHYDELYKNFAKTQIKKEEK